MRIQLITFPGCPNAAAARAALERALAMAGIADRIEEVDTSPSAAPEPLRGWGSPTVLLDGQDVGGQAAPAGPSCRVYRDDQGREHGVPPESLLTVAVRRAIGGSA